MTGEETDGNDRGEVAASAFGRAALFTILFGTLVIARDVGILPF